MKLNPTEKFAMIEFLRKNTPTAAAYFVRMAARNQTRRMSEQVFAICQNIISNYGDPEAMENARKMNPLEEEPFYKTIVAEARKDLSIDKEPTKLATLSERIKNAFSKEKKPNMTRSGLQKEFFNNTAQIFMYHYSKSPSVAAEYTKAAKKDFPTLDDKDIEIVIFGGIRKKGHMGIRFRIPEGAKRPGDYFEFSSPDSLDELIY